jgi:drug/metabolite transporter (DMT)-like permease
VLWGMGAAVGLAAYFVLSARSDVELPSVALASGGMAAGAAALAALGLLGALPLHATFGSVDFAGYHTSWLVPTVGLSLVAAVAAYVAGITAARLLGARLSSFIGLTEVLFAVLIAWLALDELPTAIQLVGGALIVAGVALVRLDEPRPVRPEDSGTSPPAAAVRPAEQHDVAAAVGAGLEQRVPRRLGFEAAGDGR